MAVKLFNKIWFKILLWILIISFTSTTSIVLYTHVIKKDTDESTYKTKTDYQDRVKNKEYMRGGFEISLKWDNNYIYYNLDIINTKYYKKIKDAYDDDYLIIVFLDYQDFALKEVKISSSEFIHSRSDKIYYLRKNAKMTKDIYKEIDGVDYVSNFLFRD